MSQKIINGQLIDKQGEVWHDNINGFLVDASIYYGQGKDNSRTYVLVFEEEQQNNKKPHGKPVQLKVKEDKDGKFEYLSKTVDTENFRLSSISNCPAKEGLHNEKLIYTYITFEKSEEVAPTALEQNEL